MIATTRIGDAAAVRDSASMRRAALEAGIPYFTTRRGRARGGGRDPRAASRGGAADRAPGPAHRVAMTSFRDAAAAIRGPLEFALRGEDAAARVHDLAADAARGARRRRRAVDPARGEEAPARGVRAARRRRRSRRRSPGSRSASRRCSTPTIPTRMLAAAGLARAGRGSEDRAGARAQGDRDASRTCCSSCRAPTRTGARSCRSRSSRSAAPPASRAP